MKKGKKKVIGGKVPTGSRIPKDPEKFGQTYHYGFRLILGELRKGFRAIARQVNLSHTTLEKYAADPQQFHIPRNKNKNRAPISQTTVSETERESFRGYPSPWPHQLQIQAVEAM